MNYLIWKGVNSSTITGLIICELPPITKPKMKVTETHIDGVDGSIYEELGYQSYDKTVKIGLKGNFDIDDVIDYFTGEGSLIFSNEPDKYYKAKIIDSIDFDRLLRFRTANVKFRVQPFKYDANDTLTGYPLRKSYDAYQKINFTTATTVHGLTFTPNGDGTVTITGTPDANRIREACTYDVVAGHKYALLFNSESGKWSTMYQAWAETGSTLRNEYNIYECPSSGTHSVGLTVLSLKPLNITIGFQAIDLTAMFGAGNEPTIEAVKKSVLNGSVFVSMNQLVNYGNFETKSGWIANRSTIEVEKNRCRWISNTTDMPKYLYRKMNWIKGHKYLVTFDVFPLIDVPIHIRTNPTNNSESVCVFNNIVTNRWKRCEAIGNIPSDSVANLSKFTIRHSSSIPLGETHRFKNIMCIDLTQMFGSGNEPQTVEEVKSYIPEEYFYTQPIDGYGWTAGSVVNYIDNIYGKYHKCVNSVDMGSLTWEKTTSYTYTIFYAEISDMAFSADFEFEEYDKRNSLSLVSFANNADNKEICSCSSYRARIMIRDDDYSDVEVFKESLSGKYLYYELSTETVSDIKDFIVINSGNHTSKPTIRIYGSGTISVKLNGITQFTYTFPSGNTYVDIDCDKQDAYVGSNLKNRNMTGGFPILNSGSNVISWTGTVTQMQFSNYSRWL